MLLICILAPVAMTVYFRKNHKLFRQKTFVKRFGEVVNNLNFRDKNAANYFVIFCYRRLFLVALIVFLQDYPYAQIQLMCLSCSYVVISVGHSNIYRLPSDLRLEYFNECTIMICVYHYICFTLFVDDPIVRYYVGYSLIGVTCFNLVVNVLLIVIHTLKGIRKATRAWRYN
jgi:hypothetical protein